MKLYNTLSKRKEEFVPTRGNTVSMYSCGPTVYYYAHIGNMRAYLFMDLLRRTLKHYGYTIDGVMNITDVGHLTSDEDTGDDKMEVASKRENKTVYEIAKYYTDFFFDQIAKLNIEKPEHIVPATSCIDEMILFVKGLQDKGFAYETSKGVYFNVAKFTKYGMLSGTNVNDKLAGARIEVDPEKVNPYDFALWIKSPKEHIMQWESPWGMGYPGWHIECSAMGRKFFGDTIDIHTGGIDHKMVHHENEIAQNDALNGKQVVRIWMHCEFLQVDGGKMSKSLGNIYTLDDLEKRGFHALDFRYFFLNAHYSKKQNFTFEALQASKISRTRLYDEATKHKLGTTKMENSEIEKYEKKFNDAVFDDLNAPLALSVVWDLIKLNKSKQIYDLLLKFDKILGLDIEKYAVEEKIDVPKEVLDLAEQRWQAKLNRNYTLSDDLRNKISILGYEILDSKENYQITKK